MNRLLFPLMYLGVKHPVKAWYVFGYPALFAALTGSALVFAPLNFNVLGERGIVETFNGLLGILIGFFIAALAAVATFERKSMDVVMRGEAPTLQLPDRETPLALTRRMYLCLLFGYLTFATLTVYVFFAGLNVVFASASPASLNVSVVGYAAGRAVFVYVYCFAVGHILSNSLLGVYYLAWRAVIFDRGDAAGPT